jgi:hypothetical protein
MGRSSSLRVALLLAGSALAAAGCGGSGGGGGGGGGGGPGPGTLVVLSPNGTETFGAGFPMTVTWTPVTGPVDLEVSTDRGNTWTTLVTSVSGAAGTVTVPAPAVSTFQARVRVSAADGDPVVVTAPSDASDADFTIGPPLVDSGETPQAVAACDFAWGDYDADGDLDLALCGLDTTTGVFLPQAKIYRNDFGLILTEVSAPLPPVYNGSVAWGDLEGDGDLELAICGGDTAGFFHTRVYRNDAGTFVDTSSDLEPVATGALVWGDVDGDGDQDLVASGIASGGDSRTRVYLNVAGVLTDSLAALPAFTFGALALGDVDGDGDLDLAACGNSAGIVLTRVFRNDGGSFVDSGARPIDLQQGAIALGDADQDGDLDLAIMGQTGAGARHTRVYRNLGGGSFADAVAGLPGASDGAIAWGDLDGDGDLDLALTGAPGGPTLGLTRLFRNDGAAYTDVTSGLQALGSSSLALGDFDGDARLDMVLGGSTGLSSFTSLYLNVGSLVDAPPEAPSGLAAYPVPGAAVFVWDASFDVETPDDGLSYNLRVTELPTYREVFPSMSRFDGRRLVPAAGVVRPNAPFPSWRLALEPGVYLVAVQAVDASYEGSEWSEEVLFVVP